jgi:hypothetical protein
VADARRDVEPDASPVVQQGSRLDLHRVAVVSGGVRNALRRAVSSLT